MKILTILAFCLLFVPFEKAAASYGTNITYNVGGGSYFGRTPIDQPVEIENNPVPGVRSINPRSADRYTGGKTITITGSNFVPGSVARLNGSNRPTTFIDYSHLLIQLSASDMNRADGFYITVFNGLPGGGYSNAAFFTIKNVSPASTNTSNSNNNFNNNSSGYDYSANSNFNNANNTANWNTNTYDAYSNTTNTTTEINRTNDTTGNSYSNLASNAIFGSNTFLPSGLVQWVLLAIIILIIVILARKIFGGEKSYHETPLKHA